MILQVPLKERMAVTAQKGDKTSEYPFASLV